MAMMMIVSEVHLAPLVLATNIRAPDLDLVLVLVGLVVAVLGINIQDLAQVLTLARVRISALEDLIRAQEINIQALVPILAQEINIQALALILGLAISIQALAQAQTLVLEAQVMVQVLVLRICPDPRLFLPRM